MPDRDEDLLQRYATDGSQPAFAALVERHLNLVYSVARRQVRSPELAEEVAQSVFADLAQNARHLSADTPLVAWLHVVARRTAIDVVRREVTRHRREADAALAASTMKPTPSPWTEIEPLLDEAVESLPPPDRTAVLLRFFEDKSLRDVGSALGISDDAAQKRVARALDQLRAFFLRRGVAVTAAGLATDLSAHALHIAPAALGSSIAAGCSPLVPTVGASTAAAVVTMTLIEKTILTAGLIIAVGGALFETNALRTQRRATADVSQRVGHLTGQIRDALSRLALSQREADAARQRLASSGPPLTPADAALEATMAAWLDRAARLRQLATERPALAIPEFEVLPFEKWLEAARESKTSSEKEITTALAILRGTAEIHFVSRLQLALKSYLAAQGGAYPQDVAELLPFFVPSVPAATLTRYKVLPAGESIQNSPRPAIEQNSPVDPLRDRSWLIWETNSRSQLTGLGTIVENAARAFMQANPGVAPPRTAAEMKAYLPPDVDPDLIDAFFNPRR